MHYPDSGGSFITCTPNRCIEVGFIQRRGEKAPLPQGVLPAAFPVDPLCVAPYAQVSTPAVAPRPTAAPSPNERDWSSIGHQPVGQSFDLMLLRIVSQPFALNLTLLIPEKDLLTPITPLRYRRGTPGKNRSCKAWHGTRLPRKGLLPLFLLSPLYNRTALSFVRLHNTKAHCLTKGRRFYFRPTCH